MEKNDGRWASLGPLDHGKLVLRRPLNMFDHYNIHLASGRFQFQPKLLLNRRRN